MSNKDTISAHMTSLPHTVGSAQTITHALDLMREHDIRHLPVLHGGELIGVVSDRDLGLVAGLNDVNPDHTKVEEAMTQGLYTVTKDTPLLEALGQMVEHKYGSVIVLDGVKVVGIFTTHDAVRMLLASLR